MNNPLEELEERFNAFIELKDPNRFYSGLTSYFHFIEDTFPLNNIAHTLFSSRSNRSVLLHNVRNSYQERVFNKSGNNFPIDPMSVSGSGLFFFHNYMVEAAKQAGLTKKKTVILHQKEARICLQSEKPRCYSMRIAKGTIPKRFEIIMGLLKTKTGKSAGDIAKLLGKDDAGRITQDNIKKEVRHINKMFKEKLDIEEELITHTESRGKNIYFLNREGFTFHTEK